MHTFLKLLVGAILVWAALSMAIGFAAMQYVGRQHIKECARVAEMVRALK